MSKSIAVAFAAFVLSCASAAATPILSGAYTVIAHNFCQQRLTADFNGSGTVDALSFSTGDVPSGQTLLSVTFNPNKAKITYAGFLDEGSSLLLQSTGSKGGTQGVPLTETPMSGSTSYSNTDTTITIGGNVYNAVYGQIDKNGIAHTAALMRLYTNGNPPDTCSEQDEATRQ
ncbi:MAG TPA: hypothetical protein VIM02_16290 [Rhizomicrobium sp.]